MFSKKFVHGVTRPTPPRIYQYGRDNLFNVRFQERRTALRCRARQVFGLCRQDVPPMAVIAVLTVGLLGDVFMLYALIHWMRDDARNHHQ
jgi:hypothetical protein